MSEVTENANANQVVDEKAVATPEPTVDGTTEAPKPARRRGLGNARGTTRLKFSHEHAAKNGLFVGHIDSVELNTITIGEETTGLPSFNGLEIPRLVITFASSEDDVLKRKYATLSFTPVESNSLTIPGGKDEWKFNQVLDWLLHTLNVFVLKGRKLTAEEEDQLSVTYNDVAEDGSYEHVEGSEVVESWKVLFENFVRMMNEGREGTPVYRTKEGKPFGVWAKLLRHTKHNKKGWQDVQNGNLAFPTFVGEGCFEIIKQNVAPSIRLDRVRETIVPMDTEKAKAPIMGAMGSPMGGGPMGGGMNMNGGVGMEDFSSGVEDNMLTEEDLPF